MNAFDEIVKKHVNTTIKSYVEHKKSAHSHIIKKLYYSTHLEGPHIDFFNSPPSLNKVELFDNLKKFQKKIVTSMGNLIHCEKAKCYLNSKVVDAMIQQIKTIEGIKKHYWENFGFIDTDIEIIQKTYHMYKLFLETYLMRILQNKTQIKPKLYSACLFENFGTNINPLKLQMFGVKRIKQLLKEIEMSKIQYSVNYPEKIKTDTELFSTMMTNILMLYNQNNQNSNNKHIICPEPHKIKIKQMSSLFENFNYSSTVSGKYIFINDLNPQMYTHDDIMLICAHDSINGIMTTKLNIKNKIHNYVKSYFIQNPKNKIFKHEIEKMLINFPYYNEGLACISEQNAGVHLNNNISLLNKQLIRTVSMVIDIGLHTELPTNSDINTTDFLSFDVFSATNYIKDITNLSDPEINAILLNILASPAKACTQELARYLMSKHKFMLEQMGYNFYETIYKLPLNMTAMTNFLADLQQIKKNIMCPF